MICGKAVGLEENEIVQEAVFKGDLFPYQVIEGGLTLQGHFEAHNRGSVRVFQTGLLRSNGVPTPAVVTWGTSLLLLTPHLLQALGGAITVIGVPIFQKDLRHPPV